jgi:hypothetical protein
MVCTTNSERTGPRSLVHGQVMLAGVALCMQRGEVVLKSCVPPLRCDLHLPSGIYYRLPQCCQSLVQLVVAEYVYVCLRYGTGHATLASDMVLVSRGFVCPAMPPDCSSAGCSRSFDYRHWWAACTDPEYRVPER